MLAIRSVLCAQQGWPCLLLSAFLSSVTALFLQESIKSCRSTEWTKLLKSPSYLAALVANFFFSTFLSNYCQTTENCFPPLSLAQVSCSAGRRPTLEPTPDPQLVMLSTMLRPKTIYKARSELLAGGRVRSAGDGESGKSRRELVDCVRRGPRRGGCIRHRVKPRKHDELRSARGV